MYVSAYSPVMCAEQSTDTSLVMTTPYIQNSLSKYCSPKGTIFREMIDSRLRQGKYNWWLYLIDYLITVPRNKENAYKGMSKGIMGICQKDTAVALKLFPLAKFGTVWASNNDSKELQPTKAMSLH